MTERRVDTLLAHYGLCHQHPTNALIHCIAVPLIMISLCGLIYAASPIALYVFLAASFVYYARLSLVFLITMLVFSALMLWIIECLGAQLLLTSLGVFVGAWVLQFIGHKIEGKKPSFFEDVQYLWVGPLFVFAKLFDRLGIKW